MVSDFLDSMQKREVTLVLHENVRMRRGLREVHSDIFSTKKSC